MNTLNLKNLKKNSLTAKEQKTINGGGWGCPHLSAYYCAVDPEFKRRYPHCC
jgi:hypothetical protein